jgi:protein-S-isoprenylcysteine O-methyltransferase Ste14
MPENLQGEAQQGVASMVGEILQDVQKLVRQELALAQREIAIAWSRAKMGVALLSSALAIFVVGGVLAGVMIAKFLHQYALPNHEWVCFGIACGLFVLAGAALTYCGIQQVERIQVSLPQSAESLHGDVPVPNGALTPSRASPITLLKP